LHKHLISSSIVHEIQYLDPFSIFLLLFTIPADLFARDIQSIGVPYVQNYPKSSYLSGNQNWSIAKDKNGLMYLAMLRDS
jgi:hypothetical protein